MRAYGSITGEIRIHEVNGSPLVTTPWNVVANGHWTAHRIENGTTLVPIWTWHPEIENWLTAGIDSPSRRLGGWQRCRLVLEVRGVSIGYAQQPPRSDLETTSGNRIHSNRPCSQSRGIILLIGLGLDCDSCPCIPA
ncbi:MAG: hypothetical protein ACJZ59_07285 [Candidatus Thalassarchaeaceae archaeon]